MSTVATDGKTMAADGQCTGEQLIYGKEVTKVRALPDGRIVGCVGTMYDLFPFSDWLANGGDKPELSDSFEGLVLSLDGKCTSYDTKCRAAPQEVPTATGSGAAVAIGAMEAGASPKQAIEIAIRRDAFTGGKVTVLSL